MGINEVHLSNKWRRSNTGRRCLVSAKALPLVRLVVSTFDHCIDKKKSLETRWPVRWWAVWWSSHFVHNYSTKSLLQFFGAFLIVCAAYTDVGSVDSFSPIIAVMTVLDAIIYWSLLFRAFSVLEVFLSYFTSESHTKTSFYFRHVCLRQDGVENRL